MQQQSWHHGLVARWWSLFRVSGPEIASFRQFVQAGLPALDVACGSGRLLVPYVEAGLDVDGCDASPRHGGMVRAGGPRGGCLAEPVLPTMHELAMPRRYRTIYVCGGLSLGSTREQDQTALHRLYEHLEPGGRLVLDNEVPYSDPTHWALWPPDRRDAQREAPRPPPTASSDRTATSTPSSRAFSP